MLAIWLCLMVVVLSPLVSAPAFAQSPTRAQIDAACRPGSDPQTPGDEAYPGGLSPRGSGLTPQYLPGATTVSAREARCMLERFPGQVVILGALGDEQLVPGSQKVGWAASATADQAQFATAMVQLSGNDKNRPMIAYCHHDRCFLSYNVALRAVQAGYRQVFWMRPGLAGWREAGYALTSPPPRPGEATLSPRFVAEVAECRKNYGTFTAQEWAGMVTQIPTVDEQDRTFRSLLTGDVGRLRDCADYLVRSYAGGDADLAYAAKLKAGAEAEVERAYLAARFEMEANPAKYLTMNWPSHQPSALRADLAAMRNGKSLTEQCGTFDFSQPAIGPNQDARVEQRDARRQQYGACLQAYRNDHSTFGKVFGLESANRWLKATRRFTCAQNRQPNCIADGPYNAVAAIATDANVAYVERRETFFRDEYSKMGDLMLALNAWIAELNRRIDAYNAGY